MISENDKQAILNVAFGVTIEGKKVKYIGTWKEPEPASNTMTFTLPRALKEPQDKMWIVTYGGAELSLFDRTISAELFAKRIFFGSEEDAKAWFDAMQDSRK